MWYEYLQNNQIELPIAPKAVANYIPAKKEGNLIYVSGQLPFAQGKLLSPGLVGESVSVEQATSAAKQCFLNALAAAVAVVKSPQEITGVLRIGGFVQAGTGFAAHPQVINGASDYAVELFGESGRHVRAAVGCSSLPLDSCVEVEVIFTCAPTKILD
jgi:enamine deaminase RidA (YjgF/YER057c/UK114 family)